MKSRNNLPPMASNELIRNLPQVDKSKPALELNSFGICKTTRNKAKFGAGVLSGIARVFRLLAENPVLWEQKVKAGNWNCTSLDIARKMMEVILSSGVSKPMRDIDLGVPDDIFELINSVQCKHRASITYEFSGKYKCAEINERLAVYDRDRFDEFTAAFGVVMFSPVVSVSMRSRLFNLFALYCDALDESKVSASFDDTKSILERDFFSNVHEESLPKRPNILESTIKKAQKANSYWRVSSMPTNTSV